MKEVKVFETFSGYGSQSMTLEDLGVPHKVVGISEIDEYAIKGYYANHDSSIPNFGDITKIVPNELPNFDLFTYSFPCQDISNSGLGKGLSEGSGTRSSLLWYCRDIIKAKQPKYLLLENVKALVGTKHKGDFLRWLDELESLGYNSEWKVINAKDCECPQNRERVFVVSYRKDIPMDFEFEDKKPLNIRLSDLMERVGSDSKFILKDRNATVSEDGLLTVDKYETAISEILQGKDWKRDEPKIIKLANTGATQHGNFNVFSPNGIARCCAARDYKDSQRVFDKTLDGKLVIRKTTPRENFRLMGVSEDRIDNILDAVSNTQAYKMAGNSIPTQMLSGIFKQMFKELI